MRVSMQVSFQGLLGKNIVLGILLSRARHDP